MAFQFYLMSGSAGISGSTFATFPVYPLNTYRQESRTGTSSVVFTAAIPFTQSLDVGSAPLAWVSPPIVGTFTLSGSVTCSMWGTEAAANNNISFGFRLWHKSASLIGTGSETNMMNSIVSGATSAGDEWTTTPTFQAYTASLINTIFNTGDRFVLRIYACGFGGANTGIGGTQTIYYGQNVSGSVGDSYIAFNQNIPLKKKVSIHDA